MVLVAFSVCLTLQSCGMFIGDSEKRSREWEQFTAQGLSAERGQRLDEAVDKYKQALSLAEKFPKTDLRRTMTEIDLAAVLHEQGKDSEALPLLVQATETYEKWKLNRSDDEEINRTGTKMSSGYRALGEIYAGQSKNDDADKAYEKALAFTKQAYFSNRFRRELAEEYATFLRKTGRAEKAAALVAPNEAVAEGLAATWEHKTLVDREFEDGRAAASRLGDQGKWEEAAAQLGKTAALCRTKYGAKDSRVLQLVGEQATDLTYAKKFPQADKLLTAGIAEHGEEPEPTLAEAYRQLSEMRLNARQYDQSIEAARKGIAVAKALGEGGIEGSCYFVVGAAYGAMPGKKSQAIENYEIGLKKRAAFVYDIPYFIAVVNLSELYINEKRLADAQKVLESGVELQKKRAPNSVYERTLRSLARVYELQGDKARSKQTLAEADRVKASS